MSTEVKIDFTLSGFHAWLMETPDTVIAHNNWAECALGKYVMICEDLKPVTKDGSHDHEDFTLQWRELDDLLMDIIHNLTYVTKVLPFKLHDELAHVPTAGRIAPTHLALAQHIEEHYLAK